MSTEEAHQADNSVATDNGGLARSAHIEQSRLRADQLITWLREYAVRRINSRLIDERKTIPPYIVLDFDEQGILSLQVARRYGGAGLTYLQDYRA